MLGNEGRLILPAIHNPNRELYIMRTNVYKKKATLLGVHLSESEVRNVGVNPHAVLTFQVAAQNRNVVRFSPIDIGGLEELMKSCNLNFVKGIFRPFIKDHIELHGKEAYEKKILIIVHILKYKNENDVNPSVDKVCFLIVESLKDVAIKFGILYQELGHIVQTIGESYDLQEVYAIEIHPLQLYHGFSAELASLYNGLAIDAAQVKLGMIGVGSLGSQILTNLMKVGYQHWTLIDDDILLPHNLARHSLSGYYLGKSKVESLKNVITSLYPKANIKASQTNYLSAEDGEKIIENLSDLSLILDVSASLPVARKLSKQNEITGRKISIFLNSKRTDLVMLAEPLNEELSLIELEVLYYRFLYKSPELHHHFDMKDSSIRYSRSCRDVSTVMEQDSIALLARVASKQIRKLGDNLSAFIKLWSIADNCQVSHFKAPIDKFQTVQKTSWTYKISESLLSSIHKARMNKLPDETGGILIGMIDLQDRMTYVVDTIFSPNDSLEYPTAYYRGIDGVENKLEHIFQKTAGNLYYLGEWHSHPDGASLNMSQADIKLLSWIQKHMSTHGLPGIMMIFGCNSNMEVYDGCF